jgi:hypothetical protein
MRVTLKSGLGLGAVALGLCLIALNVAGLFLPIPEHPFAQGIKTHKTNLARPSYEASLEALSRIDPSLPPEQRLAAVNQIMAARIVHYWPSFNQIDTDVMHSPLENWYMAMLQRTKAVLAKKTPARIEIVRAGRRDYKQILAKGVGLCGMASLAVVDYLNAQGQPAKMLPLGGHVVAYVSANGRNYILDPDKAVFIANVPAPPSRSISKILGAYSEAGYEPGKLATLKRKYEHSPMKLLDADHFQRRWRRTLIIAQIMKWLLPVSFLALGVALLWRDMGRIGDSTVRRTDDATEPV